jgi:hypothetical protein
MSTTITKTLKVKLNSKPVIEFCNDFEIPYVYCRIRLHYKDKSKIIDGVPKGVMNMTYAQAMEYNETITDPLFKSHINIILKNCEGADKLMVIDVDEKTDNQLAFDTFGDNWKTKSSRKGLPHLWRLKKENDYSTDITKIEINGKQTAIDLRYTNIFELADSKIEYIGDMSSIIEFDFETFHPKAVDEKPIPKAPRVASEGYTNLIAENTPVFKRFINHLGRINEKHVSNGDSWLKIGFAIKRVFGCLDNDLWFDILEQWSQLSPLHKAEDTEPWRKRFDAESKCGIPTILHYSELSGKEGYDAIEKEYYDAMRLVKQEELQSILNEGKRRLMEAVREYDEQQAKEKEEFPDYETMKAEFEKKYCLIKMMSCYMEECEDSFNFYKPDAFNTSHKILKYYEQEEGKRVEKIFIKRWVLDKNIRQYQKCDMYPPPLDKECPHDVFNMWKPFYIQSFKGDYIKNEKALDMFLKHMDILCNHQQEATDYLIKWTAQMFKYPAIKTIFPTMIAEEGAGRGTFIELLRKLMGEEKVFETATPSRDVWGSFNSLMTSAFFVNLNEMSLKETTGAEGIIKTLITDNAMTINPKGIAPFKTKSYHRFMTTTNNEDPIKTKKGDRRNFVVYSSNELCRENNPNVVNDYFTPLRKEMMSESGLRTIYDYLINLEGLDSFFALTIPKTEYQNDMKEANRSYYDLWLEDYVSKSPETDELGCIELNPTEMIKSFTSFLSENKIIFETNSIKLGLQMSRLKNGIPNGCITKRRVTAGNVIKFDVKKLQKHFGVGCLIDLNVINE